MRALTTAVFRRLTAGPEISGATALQQAMIELIDHGSVVHPTTGQTVFTYTHPIFWAPFTLVGDGGG